MSFSFDVTLANAYLSFTPGGASAVTQGAYTIAVLCQPAAGNNNAGFAGALVSTTQVRALFEDTNKIYGNNDFSSGFGTLTQGTWYLLAQCKAAGSNTYRHHIWPYASDGSGTMTHGVSTSSGNQGDNASAATELRIGFNVIKGNGPIAIVGFWNRQLSDAELDSMKSNLLTAWRDVSGGQPSALIHGQNYDGTNGSSATVAIGTAAFSSKTGTVNAGANPTGFNFSLGGTGATVTPSTVAAVAAVPAPTVTAQASATVTPSTVPAVAAVPAPTPRVTAVVTPATVAAVAAVPAVAVTSRATVTPAAVAAVAGVPAPTVTTTSSATVTPVTVAAVAAVPAPAVSTSGNATVAASTVAAVAAVGAVTVTSRAAVTAVTVAAVAAVPAPAVSTSGNATVAAQTVAAAAAVGVPSVSGGTSATAQPGTVAATVAVGGVTVTAVTRVTPATVAGVAAVGAPSIVTSVGAIVAAVTVAVRAAVGAPLVNPVTGPGPVPDFTVVTSPQRLVHVQQVRQLLHADRTARLVHVTRV